MFLHATRLQVRMGCVGGGQDIFVQLGNHCHVTSVTGERPPQHRSENSLPAEFWILFTWPLTI